MLVKPFEISIPSSEFKEKTALCVDTIVNLIMAEANKFILNGDTIIR